MKIYNASGNKHVSSNGFVNYFNYTAEGINRALEEIYKDLGDVVVLDGDDDWYGKAIYKPCRIAEEAGVKVLAFFHTGISGMTCSGIVIASGDLEKVLKMRGEMLGVPEHKKGMAFKSGITIYNRHGMIGRLE